MDLWQEARDSLIAKIGVVVFWSILGRVLGVISPSLLSLAGTHHILVMTLGAVLGFGIGLFAALANSSLALIFAFPAFAFWVFSGVA